MKVHCINTTPCYSYKQNFQAMKVGAHDGNVTPEIRKLAEKADYMLDLLSNKHVVYSDTNINNIQVKYTGPRQTYIERNHLELIKESGDKIISVNVQQHPSYGTCVSLKVTDSWNGGFEKVVYDSNNHERGAAYSEKLRAWSCSMRGANAFEHRITKEDTDMFEKYVGEVLSDLKDIENYF